MKKILLCSLAVAMATSVMQAQELNKEITLEKDFVPVEKKATKKSALPVVVQPSKNETPTTLSYSDWAQPTAVATSIPTMLPYGYRTSHIFSTKRGYFDFGIGTQLNMTGSAGYRVLDDPNTKLSFWLQHNSSWSGKNTTTMISEDEKQKQKFNDNVLGIDLNQHFSRGDMALGASLHFDKFNYYGGLNLTEPVVGTDMNKQQVQDLTGFYNWDDYMQTFIDAKVHGSWKSRVTISDREFDYHVGLCYNFAGYNRSFTNAYKGAKDSHINVNLGAGYQLTGTSGVGADVAVDYLSRSIEADAGDVFTDHMTMITLHPFFRYQGERASATLGANLNFSFSDGAKIRVAPNVKIDYNFAGGATLYAIAQGGKRLNTLSTMAAINRYSDPLGGYNNTFAPIDAEFGFKIGPFRGFSMKIYGGYGIFKNDQLVNVPIDNYYSSVANGVRPDQMPLGTQPFISCYPYDQLKYLCQNQYFAPVYYSSYNTRGVKVGAEINYKYRSLAELDVKAVFAPQGRDIGGKYIKGYTLGLDRAKTVVNVDLKVNPLRALTVNVGFDYRGGRYNVNSYFYKDEMPGVEEEYHNFLATSAMGDVLNLRAGASYRFDKTLTLWVQASNLLNKQWDVTMGMGAQKLNVMGGIALVF